MDLIKFVNCQLIGGPTFQQLNDNISAFFSKSMDSWVDNTAKNWKLFANEQSDFSTTKLPEADKKAFLQAADDIGILIKCQQSEEGGILAGEKYHMAYVRDQYRDSRGFLALGHKREAKVLMDFYFKIWKQYGCIHNAQPMGVPGVFHIHENDDVEITGYLIIQAFDYLRKTGDVMYLRKLMPMLEWAFNLQKKHLIDSMIPFSGDETYIAGGIVPRKAINDGSAEATLLFIESGDRLLDFTKKEKLWDSSKIANVKNTIEDTKKKYRANFFIDGKLYINNPKRALKDSLPEYRSGICLNPHHDGSWGGYHTVLQHFKGSLYFCKACMGRDNSDIEVPKSEVTYMPSACLIPIYIDTNLFTPNEKEKMLNEIIDFYTRTGKISMTKDNRVTGYDYGMFLYALATFNRPLKDEVYKKMMSLRDEAGAWVEYYFDGKPAGCRCWPWESAINIEAAIKYAFAYR